MVEALGKIGDRRAVPAWWRWWQGTDRPERSRRSPAAAINGMKRCGVAGHPCAGTDSGRGDDSDAGRGPQNTVTRAEAATALVAFGHRPFAPGAVLKNEQDGNILFHVKEALPS